MKLADLDGDGTDDLIFTTTDSAYNGKVHVLSSSTGNELAGWPVTLPGCPLSNTPAVADIDGDGGLDLVVETFGDWSGTNPGKVWAFTASGALKQGFPAFVGLEKCCTGLFSSDALPSPTLADLDDDGIPEIIVIVINSYSGLDAGAVVALKGDGSSLFTTMLPHTINAPLMWYEWPNFSVPLVGHLTGAVLPEIVVGVHASGADPPHTSFFALSAKGTILPDWPVKVIGGPQIVERSGSFVQERGADRLEAGVLGDVNGDGVEELIVTSGVIGATPPRLWAFSGTGQVLNGFPKDLPGTGDPGYGDTVAYPALADVDEDGILDIITLDMPSLSRSPSDYHLVAHTGSGLPIATLSFPASVDGNFGQQLHQLRLALAQNNTGHVCAIFPVRRYPPNQANLQLQAKCLSGLDVPGYPLTLPSLCSEPFCQDTSSVGLTRDSVMTLSAAWVDRSGNVRKVGVFTSSRSIPWGQFQGDATGSGRLLVFVDDPLWPGITRIRAIHINEARQRIEVLRKRYALSPAVWSDRTIVPGITPVKAIHIGELRTAVISIVTTAGRTAPSYTRDVAPALLITTTDLRELRAAIRALW